jgi:hypothetical protein
VLVTLPKGFWFLLARAKVTRGSGEAADRKTKQKKEEFLLLTGFPPARE